MAQILIIDEDRERRIGLMDLVTKMGYVPTEAWDGSNAAHKTDQIHFNLVISHLGITKITITNFLKSLRLGKLNRTTPVIVYGTAFEESTMTGLSKFGRVQFVKLPFTDDSLRQAADHAIKSAAAVTREKDKAAPKVYTFSKTSLEACKKVPVEEVESSFISFYPGMLQQIEPATVNFGIWMRGSKVLLQYVDPTFDAEKKKQHVTDIKGALVRLKGALQLYIRTDEKKVFYEHLEQCRNARLSAKNLRDNQKVVSELFNKIAGCATLFNCGHIDQQAIAAAEQVSLDMIQRLADKTELMGTLIELLRADPQMYDYVAIVTMTAVAIGTRLNLPDVSLKKLALGCYFHDVGLASLHMPLVVDRELTTEEQLLFRDHPSAGVDLLNALEAKGTTLPEEVFHITLQHHEKFNGTGFPDQKKGRLSKENPNGIHPLASIVTIADRFGLYLLNECRTGHIEQMRIVNAINRLAGEFDPIVLKAFREVFMLQKDAKVEWRPVA